MNLQGFEDQGRRRISNSAVALWIVEVASTSKLRSTWCLAGLQGRVIGATGAETEGAAAEGALSVETAGLSAISRAMSQTWGARHKTHVSTILGGDAAPNGLGTMRRGSQTKGADGWRRSTVWFWETDSA
jgi:hypothetical protein